MSLHTVVLGVLIYTVSTCTTVHHTIIPIFQTRESTDFTAVHQIWPSAVLSGGTLIVGCMYGHVTCMGVGGR
ncbi:hypothetical protein F5Y17DRAFT_452260 [Xylariaceae sp. FL0594]|nr:hypothetical protein F5Y17DRAFT_452260 [Xylariaceae sp. FL0594]